MNSLVNIAYIGSTLARKGPVFQLYNLVKYLDRNRFEPMILTLSLEPKDSLWDDFRRLGVACHSLGLSRFAGFFLAAPRLKQFLRRYPVDIVHSFGLRADVLSAVSFRGIPRIATRHDTFYKSRIADRGAVLGYLTESVHSAALRKLDRVVCVSDYVRQMAPAKLIEKTVTIRNGVDDKAGSAVSLKEKLQIRKRLGLPRDVRIYISVGQLSDRKDPLTVLKGFLSSPSSECSVLVILGDGPLRPQCEQLAASHSNIRIVGFADNVPDYLRATDVFVSASVAEGLPMAAIEALACGLPVVLSDIGPHYEILKLNPKAGRLFSAGDMRSLAKRLEEDINDGDRYRSEAALDIIRNHLNARAMSKKYQELYRMLVEKTDEKLQ